jgi:hypothetical protein
MARSFPWATVKPSSQFGLRATVRGTVIVADKTTLTSEKECVAT